MKKCKNIKFTLFNDKENEIIKKPKEKKINHHAIANKGPDKKTS